MRLVRIIGPWAMMVFIVVGVFWPFFAKGYIPMPASFMVAWYEPWKTETAPGGVPTIAHKAVGDDVFRQLYPFKTLAAELIRQGKLPLWNPYNGSGQPLLANLHPGYLNPFSLLLALNEKLGWAWYIILQLPLLFLATFWYGRVIGLSRLGSLMASTTLSLSGIVVARLIYGEYVYSLAVLPILLGLVEKARQRNWRLVAWCVPPIVGFLLVSGQPQISLYILATAAICACFRLDIPFLLLWVIGLGLAAVQLIPTFELYRQANLTPVASKFIFEKFLVPPAHLLSLFIPNYFGNPGTYNFWGHTDYVETVTALGLIPATLVLVALKEWRYNGLVRFFALGTLLTLVFTLNWPLSRLVYKLPLPILSTGVPTRLYILTTFFLSMLAGWGIDAMVRTRENNLRLAKRQDLRTLSSRVPPWAGRGDLYDIIKIASPAARNDKLCYPALRKSCKRLGVYFGVFGAAVVLLALLLAGSFPCRVVGVNCQTVAWRNTLLEAAVFALFVVGWWLSGKVGKRFLFGSIAVFLVLISGVYNSGKFLPFSPSAQVMPEHELLKQLTSFAPGRVMGIAEGAFTTDIATYYRYFDPNYYDPLYIRRYGELVSYVNTGDRQQGLLRSDVNVISDTQVNTELEFRRQRFWDLTGVAAIVSKKSEQTISFRRILWEDKNWRIWVNDGALPRVYLVSSSETLRDGDQLLSRLFSPEFDPQTAVLVEQPLTLNMLEGDQESTKEKAQIIRYEPDRVEIETEAAGERILVLSDNYYPGWRAWVDDKEVAVYRANYAFRGIVVPEGRHSITFVYQPSSVRRGMIISGVTFVLWLTAAVFLRRSSAH